MNRIRKQRWIDNNRDKAREIWRKYSQKIRLKEPAKSLWTAAKLRAKKNNIDFNIDISDICVPTQCPVLGIELKRSSGKPNDGSPTLDRIINNLGYTKGNIRVISSRANRLKADMTHEDCKLILKDFENCQRL